MVERKYYKTNHGFGTLNAALYVVLDEFEIGPVHIGGGAQCELELPFVDLTINFRG